MSGTLFLIGVGPGDPELLTLKATRILGSADVIAYPSGNGDSTLALDIAKAHLNPHAAHLSITIPMRVEREPAQLAYDQAATDILAYLKAGKSVAYLCEGDPLFYGSAIYLLQRLAGNSEITVVPGVTSLTASAAAIQRPLAIRNEVLKILPAPMSDEALRVELALASNIAIIKVGKHFDRIRALLVETGHVENAVVIEHATGRDQRITKLSDFAHDERPYFSTILCFVGAQP